MDGENLAMVLNRQGRIVPIMSEWRNEGYEKLPLENILRTEVWINHLHGSANYALWACGATPTEDPAHQILPKSKELDHGEEASAMVL